MNKGKRLLFIIYSLLLINSCLFSKTFFSGYTGGKFGISTPMEDDKNYPELKLQAFFQGQFSFSDNLWSHLEFSIDTENLIRSDLFEKAPSKFGIDEISFIYKSQKSNQDNYLSAFMGTYDPVGSDIFLQRYFGIQPIASKVTESWLGIAGSVLYPHFGIGVSDIIKFYNAPTAIGTYIYINNKGDENYMFNGDLRFACALRYFIFDIAAGLGAPLSSNYKGEDVFLTVNKVFWHAGTTILLGNNYTHSLFVQAGLYNMPMSRSYTIDFKIDQIYLLVEPRIKLSNWHMNISLYSLPAETVSQLMVLNNTTGVNLNIYADALSWGSKLTATGLTVNLSFKNKYLNYFIPGNLDGEGKSNNLYEDISLTGVKDLFTTTMDIAVSPYVSTNFLSGILNTRITIHPMQFTGKNWYKAITADIGYKSSL